MFPGGNQNRREEGVWIRREDYQEEGVPWAMAVDQALQIWALVIIVGMIALMFPGGNQKVEKAATIARVEDGVAKY